MKDPSLTCVLMSGWEMKTNVAFKETSKSRETAIRGT